jgi:ankyrin repeat protein
MPQTWVVSKTLNVLQKGERHLVLDEFVNLLHNNTPGGVTKKTLKCSDIRDVSSDGKAVRIEFTTEQRPYDVMFKRKEEAEDFVGKLKSCMKATVSSIAVDTTISLMAAAKKGDLKVVETVLADGCAINSTDSDGWTPLMGATLNGHLKVVERLIAAKGEINLGSKDGTTALMLAAKRGHVDVAERLLSQVHTIAVNSTDAGGRTALMYASHKGDIGSSFYSEIGDRHAVVRRLLAAPDIEINIADKHGWTALMFASKTDFAAARDRLLAAEGIDRDLRNADGNTAADLQQ